MCYYVCVRGADNLLLITEWKEFRGPNEQPVIFDGRNQYDPAISDKYRFELYQIGVK